MVGRHDWKVNGNMIMHIRNNKDITMYAWIYILFFYETCALYYYFHGKYLGITCASFKFETFLAFVKTIKDKVTQICVRIFRILWFGKISFYMHYYINSPTSIRS